MTLSPPSSDSSAARSIAYDLVADAIGVGYNGPRLLVVDRELPGVTDDRVQSVAHRVVAEPGMSRSCSRNDASGVLASDGSSSPNPGGPWQVRPCAARCR